MTLEEMIHAAAAEGYSSENAEAKVCQDLILKGIAGSSLSRNATIKGGVVMRSISGNVRRATQDLDIDFIKYSLDDASVARFLEKINCVPGIEIKQIREIQELKQQDYHGKRVFVKITDETGDSIESKIDFGVHKMAEIAQEEFCFDIACFENGANLLINTKEQMYAEKLRSLLRFGTISTRYKDIFDLWYLAKFVNLEQVRACVRLMILDDKKMREQSVHDIVSRTERILTDKEYLSKLEKSGKNWTEETLDQIVSDIISFVHAL